MWMIVDRVLHRRVKWIVSVFRLMLSLVFELITRNLIVFSHNGKDDSFGLTWWRRFREQHGQRNTQDWCNTARDWTNHALWLYWWLNSKCCRMLIIANYRSRVINGLDELAIGNRSLSSYVVADRLGHGFPKILGLLMVCLDMCLI